MQTDGSNALADDSAARRSFLVRFTAIMTGGLVALFPFVAGWGVFTDPLRRRARAADTDNGDMAGFTPICPLDALPADGVPRAFPVIADATDAWTRTPAQRLGVVFLTRTDKGGEPKITAFTATCPHLGCAVEFNGASDQYECPCHKSGFAKDGQQIFGPSRRGLDKLDAKLVEKSGEKEILVAYQRFQAGIAERKPVG